MLPLQAGREASSGVGAFFYERHRPAPTSTAEVETTEIRAKGDAKACPRMPLLVDSVSFLTVDFRQKGV